MFCLARLFSQTFKVRLMNIPFALSADELMQTLPENKGKLVL
jgi:hypothetical protein